MYGASKRVDKLMSRRLLLAGSAGLALASTGCMRDGPEADTDSSLQIGYPVTTLINGQVGQVLERTNIFELNELHGNAIQFTHGPPANEAMAAGRINVQLTSEAPAVSAIAQGVDAVCVFSLGMSRDALVVPADSRIGNVTDLRAATIGVPIGTTPYVHLVELLRKNELIPGRDVALQNVSPEELPQAFASGSVEGIYYNEPLPSQLARAMDARVVAEHSFMYVALMRHSLPQSHRDVARRFLLAVAESTFYLSMNKRKVDGWFSEVSRTDLEVVQAASQHTPAYAETRQLADIDLGFSTGSINRLQTVATLLRKYDLIDSLPRMNTKVDRSLWAETLETLKKSKFGLDQVKEK